jgi:hypothetical protein
MSGETHSSATGGPAPAGWGLTGQLPPAIQRRMAAADAAEYRIEREQEAERERLAEEWHQRAVTLAVQQAEARGDVFDVMALARGEVRGRSVGDILAGAVAAAEAGDRRAEMRLYQEGHGQPERLHVEVGEPNIIHAPAARSVTGRAIFNRARRFRDLLEARRQLEAAEQAAWQSRHDCGLVDGVTVQPREDRGDVVFARHEDSSRPVSFR